MRYLRTQDILNALHVNVREIHADDVTDNDFDKISNHIYRLIEKLIFRCLGSIPATRKKLEAEGLEEYLEIYIDMSL